MIDFNFYMGVVLYNYVKKKLSFGKLLSIYHTNGTTRLSGVK